MDRAASFPSHSRSGTPSQQHRTHFFIPCLRGFRRQLGRYWNGRLALGSRAAGPWARLPAYADFAALSIVAARGYMHLHHHAQYREHGLATPSPVATRLTVGAIRLPPYVLAMIRELARPMTLDSHTLLLPYLPLHTSDDARGQGPAPPLGFKLPRDPQVVALLVGLLGGLHALRPLVGTNPSEERCEAEALARPCTASICRKGDGRMFVLHSGQTLADREPFPSWRLEAMAALRPLREGCAWIAGCDLLDSAWAVEGKRGGNARFCRCDQKVPLEVEEEEWDGEEGGGVGVNGSSGHYHDQQQQQQQQQEEGRVLASMPPLLKHLLSSSEADCPGYAVETYSTQGADVFSPFPTHPPLGEDDGGGGGGGQGLETGLDASGSGSGKWWKRGK